MIVAAGNSIDPAADLALLCEVEGGVLDRSDLSGRNRVAINWSDVMRRDLDRMIEDVAGVVAG